MEGPARPRSRPAGPDRPPPPGDTGASADEALHTTAVTARLAASHGGIRAGLGRSRRPPTPPGRARPVGPPKRTGEKETAAASTARALLGGSRQRRRRGKEGGGGGEDRVASPIAAIDPRAPLPDLGAPAGLYSDTVATRTMAAR
nr:uncharacterized protein LOC127315837 [Lolium perenne]